MSVLVSVYITNFNYQAYIEDSILSVLNQTLQSFELIIIDDGSTDESKRIIEKYRFHEKVQIIYQKNKGLNVTNNVAMRMAQGKYLVRLDADDFFELDALEKMSFALEQDDSLGLVFPNYYYINSDGARIAEEKRHNFDKDVSLFDQPAHGACTMIRLEFLKRVGGYNESFTCQDGYDLWIKFVTHFKVSNIETPLFNYRQHGNNLTTNEERILETRREIKNNFISAQNHSPSTLAIIPIRNIQIGGESLPLYRHKEKTLIEEKVEACLNAKYIKKVAIVSSDQDILYFVKSKFSSNKDVLIFERPKHFESKDQNLSDTINLCLKQAKVSTEAINFDTIITLALEYPFIKPEIIDDMVNTQLIFKSDSVLSVRPDTKIYYQHTGHSLKPILNQDKYVRIEREALYKSAGGLSLSTIDHFERHSTVNQGIISHVVLDERSSFGILSNFDFKIYKLLKENE